MKKAIFIFVILVLAFVSCEESVVPKPEALIKEKKMIEMLADIHLAEATFTRFRYDSAMVHSTSANFYYSILDKYQIQDSVFEQSFVYYASTPKSFEEMYRKVMNKLSVLEQEYSGRKEELLQFDEEEQK